MAPLPHGGAKPRLGLPIVPDRVPLARTPAPAALLPEGGVCVPPRCRAALGKPDSGCGGRGGQGNRGTAAELQGLPLSSTTCGLPTPAVNLWRLPCANGRKARYLHGPATSGISALLGFFWRSSQRGGPCTVPGIPRGGGQAPSRFVRHHLGCAHR